MPFASSNLLQPDRFNVWRNSRRAFTLVELLVVTGIIAILISILLPTLSAVRRQANLLACSSNLRQLSTACLLRTQDSKGWLPLAGEMHIDTALPYTTPVNVLVSDQYRNRYVYATAPRNTTGGLALVPMPGAIAKYLGHRDLDFSDWDHLDLQLNDKNGPWRYFICPSTNSLDSALKNDGTTPVGQAMMIDVVDGNVPWSWSTNTDYAFNEGVFGYTYDRRFSNRRWAGQLSRIRRPSEVAMFTDAIPRPTPAVYFATDGWSAWTPSLTSTGPVTLADAFLNNGKANDVTSFDTKRHKNRMNVVFLDSHVEAMQINARDLAHVFLLPE